MTDAGRQDGSVAEPAAKPNRIDGLRDELDGVDELPVGDRVEVFERVNEGIATELSRLDEV